MNSINHACHKCPYAIPKYWRDRYNKYQKLVLDYQLKRGRYA